jgi:hypothetical protein
MKKINRIRPLSTKSHLVRCFCVTERLSALKYDGEHTYYQNEGPGLLAEKPTSDFLGTEGARRAVAALLEVQGIDWVLVRSYEINVHIAAAFNWTDGIHDEVLRIIQEHIFAGVENVEVVYADGSTIAPKQAA